MKKLTLMQATAGLASGEFTAVQLTAAALAQIVDERGGGTRVYANIHRVGATASAGLRSATRRRLASVGAGWRADLSQDLFDVAGEVTTAGSRVLADAPAAENTLR